MAEKIRKFMRSERGRAFVNAMFILATMVRGSGMMFLADIFWVVWLLFCIRESKTKVPGRALMDEVGTLAHCKYEEDDKKDVSLRIIADHVKSCTFMASDGIMPSNEGRGYVFRRLLRRAARHGRILGIEGNFMTKLAQVVIDLSKDGYPELEEKFPSVSSLTT